MSKSLGNVTAPQDVIKQAGADILRMWVCAADYADDLRIGPEILKTTVDTYRKLRNTLRWMLGNLAHFHAADRGRAGKNAGARAADAASARRARSAGPPGLCGFRLQAHLRRAQRLHDGRSVGVLFRYPQGCAVLRSVFVDDAQGLPHRARSSVPRHGDWLAPMLCFTAEEAWLRARSRPRSRFISSRFRTCRSRGATMRWRRNGASCAMCAASSPARSNLNAPPSASARRSKRIPSSTSPIADLFAAVVDADLAELCITSGATLVEGEGPTEAFRLTDVAGVAVVPRLARGPQMRALLENLAGRRSRSAISRRHAARRPGAARMGSACARRPSRGLACGGCGAKPAGEAPMSGAGSAPSVLRSRPSPAPSIRPSKFWLLYDFDLASRAPVALTPFIDLRADLEYRHQLRPVPAAGAGRPMGAARLQGGGGGVPVGLAGRGRHRG